MHATEVGREFLTRVCDYLVSFPFDLKVLQEAVADPDLDRSVRELAAGVLIHAIGHQEGGGPERFVDDVLLLRIALDRIACAGGDGAENFCMRFEEVYSKLRDDIKVFEEFLGPELWSWLCSRVTTLSRLPLKGKRASHYVEDASAWDALYEEGVDFQTNYDVTETQVHNKLRRPEQLLEHVQRRHAEDCKRRASNP